MKKEKQEKPVKQPKLDLKASWLEVMKKQRGLMIAMIAMAVFSLVLLAVSLATLRPQRTVVIVGYGDVYGEMAGLSGGYRRDSWMNMLAFPLLAVIFAVVHNIITLRVYKKYGKNVAFLVVFATILLILGAFIVLLRLLGEW